MNGLQGWLFVLVIAALVARGLDRVRICREDLPILGAALGLALLQRLLRDQVTLDDPFVAPLLMALPVLAGLRAGTRAGIVTALGSWLLLAALAGSLEVRGRGEISQEAFVVAALLAALLGGAAGSLPARVRWAGAMFPLAWIVFFAIRDAGLATVPSILAVPVLACGWTALGAAFPAPRTAEAA